MRTYLVLMGVAVIAVGISLVISGVLNFPQTVSTDMTENPALVVNPGSSSELSITSVPGATTLFLFFSTTAPVQVVLSSCSPASSSCTLDTSNVTSSGAFTVQHPLSLYYLTASNGGKVLAHLSVKIDFKSVDQQGLPFWEEIAVLAGGGILIAGGAVGLFLGLFLQGNPYVPRGGDPEPGPPGSP